MSPIDAVEAALTAAGCGPKRRGSGLDARCPAHEDRSPSLTVSPGTVHPVVFHCHAGCDPEDVRRALGLEWAELCEDRPDERPTVVAEYPYHDAEGTLVLTVRRLEPGHDGKRKSFTRSPKGAPSPLYGLPAVLSTAARGGTVWVCEGEKDADALDRAGATATCNPGGAGKFLPEHAAALTGAHVVIVTDRDAPGYRHALEVFEALTDRAASARIVEAVTGKDAADHLGAGHDLDAFAPVTPGELADRLAGGANATTEPEPDLERWESPVPLTGTTSPPPFPVDQMPEPLATFVASTSASMRTAPDLLAAFVLAATATVVAGRWRVEVEPGGWAEPLTLHVVAVAPPGCMKSPAMDKATEPLVSLEAELADRYGPEVAQAATERRIAEGRLKRLEGEAASAKNPNAEREALELAHHLAAEVPPVVPRLFTTDSTPEALERLLATQHERIAWLDSEGGIFRMAAGGYSARGSAPNIEVFVKGHSGDAIKVDRVGREPLALKSPSLTIGVAVQPSVMVAAGQNVDLTGRGLLARQLIAWPDLLPVDRSQPATPAAPAAVAAYADRLHELYRAGAALGPGTVRTLTVDPDALHALREWFAWTSAEQRTGGELAGIADWAAKLDGATVRLAGVLTLAADPDASSVTLDAAGRAIALARYFTAHARRAFGEVGLRDDVRHARTCLEAIRRARPTGDRWRDWPDYVTTREVHRAVASADLARADDVREALTTLAEAGYLRRQDGRERGRGRPPERWAVNPEALK